MNPNISWNWYTFSELSVDLLYDIIALRESVFIVEQDCPYPEADGLDRDAMHLVGTDGDKVVAYLRYYMTDGYIKIGRIVNRQDYRGLGLGKLMIHMAIETIQQKHSNVPIKISAQHRLQQYYESAGFIAFGDVYDEDGIPHIGMEYAQ